MRGLTAAACFPVLPLPLPLLSWPDWTTRWPLARVLLGGECRSSRVQAAPSRLRLPPPSFLMPGAWASQTPAECVLSGWPLPANPRLSRGPTLFRKLRCLCPTWWDRPCVWGSVWWRADVVAGHSSPASRRVSLLLGGSPHASRRVCASYDLPHHRQGDFRKLVEKWRENQTGELRHFSKRDATCLRHPGRTEGPGTEARQCGRLPCGLRERGAR